MTGLSRVLPALIAVQICLHASMAGLRMALPLRALGQGHAEAAVGVLLALFAVAPIALALPAGRLADRRGYHHPLRIAVALTLAGGAAALLSLAFAASAFGWLCAAALLSGAGANIGLITMQRSAGRGAVDATQLKRVFSWLGLAPALANMVGPMLAGVLIDLAGYGSAFAALAALPLLALGWAVRVPRETPPERAPRPPGQTSWDLLRTPGLKRLLLINWMLSASWDVHTFVLPILGHERGFSASAIGTILGAFAASVAAVRVAIPWLAHRLQEAQVMVGAMLLSGLCMAVYPLVQHPVAMGGVAVVLGLSLGSTQPMIMSMLHQLTPAQRHGEAIALRSMTINASSALMPLLFGAVGAAVGASSLFWAMGAVLGGGSRSARRLAAVRHA